MPKKKDTIGGRIKAVREAKHCSQRALAHAIGHNGADAGAYISHIERGDTEPRFTTLAKIAEVLGVPMSELMPAS